MQRKRKSTTENLDVPTEPYAGEYTDGTYIVRQARGLKAARKKLIEECPQGTELELVRKVK